MALYYSDNKKGGHCPPSTLRIERELFSLDYESSRYERDSRGGSAGGGRGGYRSEERV